MMPKISKQSVKRKRRTTSVVDRIGSMSFSDHVKINIYGHSATGKTSLWATFPKPILVILCSGGRNQEELKTLNTLEYRKSVKQVVLHSTTEVPAIVDHLKDNPGKFKTVVLDHLTDFQLLNLKELLGIDKIPPQLSWGMATQQKYGQCTLQTKEHLRSLLDLEMNVVLVAQQREFGRGDDEESELSMPFVGSAVTPSTVGWLNPACTYIVQTFKQGKTVTKSIVMKNKTVKKEVSVPGVDYCLRVGPSGIFTTKFRVPKGTKLPEYIVDPTYDKILALINGG